MMTAKLKAVVDELSKLPAAEQDRASRLIEERVHPQVTRPTPEQLEAEYREAAADKEREAEALEWVEADLLDPKDEMPAW